MKNLSRGLKYQSNTDWKSVISRTNRLPSRAECAELTSSNLCDRNDLRS